MVVVVSTSGERKAAEKCAASFFGVADFAAVVTEVVFFFLWTLATESRGCGCLGLALSRAESEDSSHLVARPQ